MKKSSQSVVVLCAVLANVLSTCVYADAGLFIAGPNQRLVKKRLLPAQIKRLENNANKAEGERLAKENLKPLAQLSLGSVFEIGQTFGTGNEMFFKGILMKEPRNPFDLVNGNKNKTIKVCSLSGNGSEITLHGSDKLKFEDALEKGEIESISEADAKNDFNDLSLSGKLIAIKHISVELIPLGNSGKNTAFSLECMALRVSSKNDFSKKLASLTFTVKDLKEALGPYLKNILPPQNDEKAAVEPSEEKEEPTKEIESLKTGQADNTLDGGSEDGSISDSGK